MERVLAETDFYSVFEKILVRREGVPTYLTKKHIIPNFVFFSNIFQVAISLHRNTLLAILIISNVYLDLWKAVISIRRKYIKETIERNKQITFSLSWTKTEDGNEKFWATLIKNSKIE